MRSIYFYFIALKKEKKNKSKTQNSRKNTLEKLISKMSSRLYRDADERTVRSTNQITTQSKTSKIEIKKRDDTHIENRR
jgi:hypothetical protein